MKPKLAALVVCGCPLIVFAWFAIQEAAWQGDYDLQIEFRGTRLEQVNSVDCVAVWDAAEVPSVPQGQSLRRAILGHRQSTWRPQDDRPPTVRVRLAGRTSLAGWERVRVQDRLLVVAATDSDGSERIWTVAIPDSRDSRTLVVSIE